jgi:hypothetical protein
MRHTLLIAAVVLVAGCGVRAKSMIEPHQGDVCLLAGSPPKDLGFEVLGRVVATKKSYGSTDQLFPAMAREARNMGADAIINLQAGQRFKGPLPWRVTSPTGDGMAIKVFPDGSALDCHAAGGKLSRSKVQPAYVVQTPAPVEKEHDSSDDLYADLIRLNDLRERGILTDAEFNAEKKELLDDN